MSIGIRSCASARTPQLPQPTCVAVVSTVTTSSAGPFGDRQHPEPVQSQKRLRQADTVVRHQGSPIAVAVEKPQRWRGPWPLWWMLLLPHAPHSNAESR